MRFEFLQGRTGAGGGIYGAQGDAFDFFQETRWRDFFFFFSNKGSEGMRLIFTGGIRKAVCLLLAIRKEVG